MKKASLYLSVAVFLGALGVSWLTHGTGVIQNDTARNIYIPKELTIGWEVYTTFYVPSFTLTLILVAAIILTAIGILGGYRRVG